MAASPREMEQIRNRGVEAEAAKFEQFGLPPSMALRQTFDEYQQSRIARGQSVAQPNTRAFMEAAAAAGNPISVNEAFQLQSGVMGSNVDTRNWSAIMSAADPVAAAREATRQYYERGAVRRPYDPEREARALRANYKDAQRVRARQIENMLSGNMADPAGSIAYGVSPEQLERYRAAQGTGGQRGIISLLQSQGTSGLAPAISEMFQERSAEIRRGGAPAPDARFDVQETFGPFGFAEDTGRVGLLDPRGEVLTTLGGRNRDVSPRALSRLASYGIDPYTLRPMYQTTVSETGERSLTPAFDVLGLGYDFGELSPYSSEGITSYLGSLAGTPLSVGQNISQAYFTDLGNRMGYGVTPVGQFQNPAFSYVPA